MHCQITPAQAQDLEAINQLYNGFVATTHITFDETPWTHEKRQAWFQQFADGPYCLLVAKLREQVIGFAYTSRFRPKSAYNQSAEVTIYTNPEVAPTATGSLLYEALIQQAQAHFHRIYAIIALPNEASLALHKKFGFAEVGQLNEVGYKLGQYYTVSIWEKSLPS